MVSELIQREHNSRVACVYPVTRVKIAEMIVKITVRIVRRARGYRGCSIANGAPVIVHSDDVVQWFITCFQSVICIYDARAIRYCRHEVVCLRVPKRRVINFCAVRFSDTQRRRAVSEYAVENHDTVKEAKLRANEIIALAQRDAKAIRIGSREYSNEILTQLDVEIEKQKEQLIKSMQESFEKVAKEIDENLTQTGTIIKENIAELRTM